VSAGQGPGVAGYLIVIAAAFAVSFLSMPLLRRLAWRVGAIDRPDPRRVHKEPTPVLGGPGILAGLLCGLLVAWLSGEFTEIFRTITPPLGVVLAATAVYVVGQLDDLRELSPPAKMAGIVLAGSILSLAGVSIIFFRIPFFGLYALSPDLSALITVVWVAGMANAINFIDGLDGLAAGVVAIAAGSFILYAEHLDDLGGIDQANIGPLVAAAVLGACLGYLPWNFHPAKIFMGDAGALTLGLSMAAVTIAIGGNSDVQVTGQTYFFFAPLFLPLLILGVPLVDTAWAIMRRAKSRSGVTIADKGHLHHRLMRLGHGQRRSVLILWTWTALLSAVVLFPTYTGRGDTLIPAGVAALAVILFTLFAPGVRSARRASGTVEPPPPVAETPPTPPPEPARR
jgi:UDP-GlcNAc:undecaprenyl-phosphate/decaprenyl-phosphate GlcNAc-1-phosphate transferase